MQSFLKVLTILIFVFSTLVFGVTLMFVYAATGPQNDVHKKLAEIKRENQQDATKLKELTEARGGAKEADQGIEYWEGELGKAQNANKRREEKEYPDLMQGLTTKFGQDKGKFDKTEEENIKAAAQTLNDKQKTLRDMRVKVQQARVEHQKAKNDIEGLEAQKKELLNRTAQSTILLDDVRKRHQEVTAQLDSAKKASPGTSP
jgi:chromosome segregation ATPase